MSIQPSHICWRTAACKGKHMTCYWLLMDNNWNLAHEATNYQFLLKFFCSMWLGILTPPMLCGSFYVWTHHVFHPLRAGLSVQLQPGACRWQQLSGCGSGHDRRIEAVSVSGVLPPEPHSYLADDRPGPDCGWDPEHHHWAEPLPSSTTDTHSKLWDWKSQSEWGSAEKRTLSIRWC